ncbi:MAG: hypothetical protein ACI8Q1_000444 [Parvicella sp.]|jgi:hypothetical protein
MTKEQIVNFCIVMLMGILVVGCTTKGKDTYSSEKNGMTIELTNATGFERNETVVIQKSDFSEEKNIPIGKWRVDKDLVEVLDADDDKIADYVSIKSKWAAEETKLFDLSKILGKEQSTEQFTKTTQAEISTKVGGKWEDREYIGGEFKNIERLKVPAEHTDHSYYIRYEGPGIENELIGYRYYLDWRNAMDIFGKRVDTLVLKSVGQDGFDSYHEPAPWGMDVLKAGKSLGIGSIGQFINNKVEHFENTDSVICSVKNIRPYESSIETTYFGWESSEGKNTLSSILICSSKDRALKHEITTKKVMEHLCTGIVKSENAPKIQSLVGSEGWAYLATFGKQSLADDNLGLAIIYNTKDVQHILDSEYDHLLVFKPTERKITYYLLGAWEQEKNGIKNKNQFLQYLNNKVELLNNPISVSIK